MRHPITLLALAVWLFAWGRLIVQTATTPSPAHEVRFLDPQGQPSKRPYCHGAVWVIDGTPWMMCSVDGEAGANPTDHLTRYDLSAGAATLLHALPDHGWRGISAATPHPDGSLVLVDGDSAVQHWTPDGTWTDLELPGYKSKPCVAFRDGRLEVVYGTGGGKVAISRRDEAGWTTQETARLPRIEGLEQRYEACETTPTGWRLTWIRYPEKAVPGPVQVETWEQTQVDATPTLAHTLSLDPEARPARARTHEGRIFVEDMLLMRTSAIARWSSPPPYERGPDGTWQPPRLPPTVTSAIVGHAHVFGGPRAGTALIFDLGRPFARVEGRWFTTADEKTLRLAELPPDLSEPKEFGPQIANRFWLSTGLKMFPDDKDGYWLMGSLGEAYVHLNAKLERTDEHSFLGRFARAFQTDRAKRNSDFYYELAILKKASFLWVLFALPLAGAILRRRLPLASQIYLAGALIGGWWWWKLSGPFW